MIRLGATNFTIWKSEKHRLFSGYDFWPYVLQSAFALVPSYLMRFSDVFMRFRAVVIAAFVVCFCGVIAGQRPNVAPSPSPTATPARSQERPTPTPAGSTKGGPVAATAEQVAESAILISALQNGFPIGRPMLNQIRKTTVERGRITVINTDGKQENVPYERFVIRGDDLSKERIRLDQTFPSARYALVQAEDKVFGIYNNSSFTPREDAAKAFQNQIHRSLEALLRYKENGAKVELQPREKIMGVDYYVIDVVDKRERRTRFFISAKSFRVMMLTYEEDGIKYKRKFYDYNYAQGTLVPYRSVLWAGDKIVEEVDVGTITFGQKVDEDLFKAA